MYVGGEGWIKGGVINWILHRVRSLESATPSPCSCEHLSSHLRTSKPRLVFSLNLISGVSGAWSARRVFVAVWWWNIRVCFLLLTDVQISENFHLFHTHLFIKRRKNNCFLFGHTVTRSDAESLAADFFFLQFINVHWSRNAKVWKGDGLENPFVKCQKK